MSKTVVIFAITGNQGSSVADAFLKKSGWKIRGVTRNPDKAESQALAKKGIEIVRGDADDVDSLVAAVRGADVVFGNTAYSEKAGNPSSQDLALLNPGQEMREWCYELELQQGKNIADAVATLDTLELFIWSSLSNASKWSNGKYQGVNHFDSKAHVVEYIQEQHPRLAAKMSILQMGLFIDNWRWGQVSVPWKKAPDGTMKLRIPGSGDELVPFVIPHEAGIYVEALLELPVGTNLLASSDRISWAAFVKIWSRVTGNPAALEKVTVEDHAELKPGGFGREMGEMYAYMQDFGYHGGDPSVTFSQDVKLSQRVTKIEEYIAMENWEPLLSR